MIAQQLDQRAEHTARLFSFHLVLTGAANYHPPPMTIRRTPQDFRVDEVLSPEFLANIRQEPSHPAAFALYRLTKASLTTPEACALFARELRVRPGDVQPAGLKDKHACTTQHVSAAFRTAQSNQRAPRTAGGPAWSAELLGWIDAPIDSSAILRNRFVIVVRDLSVQASQEMSRRAALLRTDRGLEIINYFGDQRFGSARHGEGFVAPHLIRGDFENALRLSIATPARKDSGSKRRFTRVAASRWGDFPGMLNDLPRCPERRAIEHLVAHPGDFRGAFATLPMFFQQMCVEAYQSLIWNAVTRGLSERIAAELPTPAAPTPDHPRVKPAPAALRTPDDYGELVFPVASALSDRWRQLDVPILGKASRLLPPWDEIAVSVLEQEGITTDQLQIPGLRRPYFGEASRALVVASERFTMSEHEHDELSGGKRVKRTLSFELPRGSYATVVLRALGQ